MTPDKLHELLQTLEWKTSSDIDIPEDALGFELEIMNWLIIKQVS